MSKRRSIFVGIVGALTIGIILVIGFAVWIIPRSPFLSGLIEHQFGPVIPASSYARNLDSSDNDLVRESLYFLTKRKDRVAVPKAITLLQSSDDYIWLNAAHYLGSCKRPEAVPYLIKALRHTAWRSDLETARDLHDITGEDFGTDFKRWQQWWLTKHPGFEFDWESHLGPMPRVTKDDPEKQQ